jgi:hypothetical protein
MIRVIAVAHGYFVFHSLISEFDTEMTQEA